MTSQHPFEREHQRLIERLHEMPMQPPPLGIGAQVMARINDRRSQRFRRLARLTLAPISIRFRPALVGCFGILLIAVFVLGRYSVRQEGADPLQLLDAEAAYLVGRELLAAEKQAAALTLLQLAANLAPENPDFALWEGIAHWHNKQPEQERSSYLRGLSSTPDSLPLLINLGHHHLSNGSYLDALDAYRKALTIDPLEPTAWYNSGLIYRLLDRKEEEIDAWKNFLYRQRFGIRALRAVERLNSAGDYSYRPYWIGPRRVIIHTEALLAEDSALTNLRHEAAMLTALLTENQELTLTIATFYAGNTDRARQRALLLKQLIAEAPGSPLENRIAVSWFDSPETIMLPSTESRTRAEGVLLFGFSDHQQNQEVSI
ncbi:MAG: tetratricopeptide repeat protein [Desulfobulbaceae bacterium]|nr:tetratricopeptide repeat protein [Desulfobulbaceae bacterium]